MLSYTYVYQIGPFKLGLLVRTQLYLLGDNTSITNQEVPVLSPTTANFIGQLFRILTNNLNLKTSI